MGSLHYGNMAFTQSLTLQVEFGPVAGRKNRNLGARVAQALDVKHHPLANREMIQSEGIDGYTFRRLL